MLKTSKLASDEEEEIPRFTRSLMRLVIRFMYSYLKGVSSAIADEEISHAEMKGRCLLADKAYRSAKLRKSIECQGADYCIPFKTNVLAP